MTTIMVLIDYKTKDGRFEGIAMDMGDDLPLIAKQLSIVEKNPLEEREFHAAYVLGLHDEQPSDCYIPDNLFGEQACGLDGSAQLPIGKRWFSLIMKVEAGAFGEEE